jgi:hypothetical protein
MSFSLLKNHNRTTHGSEEVWARKCTKNDMVCLLWFERRVKLDGLPPNVLYLRKAASTFDDLWCLDLETWHHTTYAGSLGMRRRRCAQTGLEEYKYFPRWPLLLSFFITLALCFSKIALILSYGSPLSENPRDRQDMALASCGLLLQGFTKSIYLLFVSLLPSEYSSGRSMALGRYIF